MNISFSSQNQINSTSNHNFKISSTQNSTNNNDSKSITQQNKAIEDLMKQKEVINKNKKDYMEKALDKGYDPSSIKDQLKDFDKQIQDIDKQISQLKIEDQSKALSNNEEDSDNATSKNTSKDNSVDNATGNNSGEQIKSLFEVYGSMSTTNFLFHQRNNLQISANVSEADVKDDKRLNLSSKEDERLLEKAKDGIDDVNKRLSHALKETHDKINNSRKSKASAKNETSAKDQINENTEETKLNTTNAASVILSYADNANYKEKSDIGNVSTKI